MQRSGQPIKKRNKPQPVPLQSNTFTMAKLSMAKQKFRPTRLGGFSGTKAYIRYVEILKKRRNAVGRTFCDANG
jgi:hypothetical protein